LADLILENRDLFLSQNANFRFRGYAFAQLKRIRRHRQWLLYPIEKKPTRADFDLPEHTVVPADQLQAAESLISKLVDEWIFEQEEMTPELLLAVREKTRKTFVEAFSGFSIGITDNYGDLDRSALSNSAGRLLGYSDNFLELLDRERKYKSAIKGYKQFKEWEKNRNPTRAELERKFLFDTKHASHLVRLLKMAKEILTERKVIVCRPDADELLAIRNGSWDYDTLISWAENQDKEIQGFYNSGKSVLPKKPNIKKLDALCVKLVEKSLSWTIG